MDEKEFQKKLSRERQEIDRIDKQLLPLFLERMGCVERVGELKRQAGAPVRNAAREQEIIDRVSRQAGELGPSAAAFYKAVMAISRDREHAVINEDSALRRLERTAARRLPDKVDRVVCQGVRGAYSHQAARRLFPGADISFVPEFSQVFRDVSEGALGVVPVENSAAGSVTAVYDLILKYRFFILGAVDIRIEHCLAAAVPGPVTKVLSHPQALAQCSEFITDRGMQAQEYSNTAAAAQAVAERGEPGLGAICSEDAANRYGLVILERGVQNVRNNTTRFVAVSKEPVLPEGASKISLCFSLPHTTGSLHGVLRRFDGLGLNLTKIESRPIPGRDFEYDFYLDFTGSIHDAETLNLICALNAELPRFSFLGNYNELPAEEETI